MKINLKKNKLSFHFALMFICLNVFGSDGSPTLFKITGNAKKVLFFSSKTEKSASGKLSNGDIINIYFKQADYYVTVTHGTITKTLAEQNCCISKNSSNDLFSEIGVYEYDFDKDGNDELIIVHSNELLSSIAEIFRYSVGISERIGFIPFQFEFILSQNEIRTPLGSQGLGESYIYKDGFIFELKRNVPEQMEKNYYKK